MMRTTRTIGLAALLLGLAPVVSFCQEPTRSNQIAAPAASAAPTGLSAEKESKLQAELARTMAALTKAQRADRPNRATVERLEKKASGLREQLGITGSAASGCCPFGGPGPMGGQFGRGPAAGRAASAGGPETGRGRGPAGAVAGAGCPCGRCPRQAIDAVGQPGTGRGPAAGRSQAGAGRGGPRGGGYGRGAGFGRGGAR